jgi:hypothetical protein
MKGKGFDRIRSIAAAGAMGLSFFGGASIARAVSKSLPAVVTISHNNWTVHWGGSISNGIDNQSTSMLTTGGNEVSKSFFCISDATLTVGGNTYGDAFDGAFQLLLDGVAFANPDGNVDLTGNTLTTDTITISGLQTTIQYYFVPDRPVIRIQYSFHNAGGSPVSVPALIGGNLGSDDDSTIQMTSDGDQAVERSDKWYFSNDSGTVGDEPDSDPNFTLSRFFDGAEVIPTSVAFPGNETEDGYYDFFTEKYDITVQPGTTARILIFCQLSSSNADAQAGAADFETLEAAQNAGLLNGLSASEINEIVNGGPVETLEPTEVKAHSIPVMGFIAELLFTGFLGLFGITSLRRRKKNDPS